MSIFLSFLYIFYFMQLNDELSWFIILLNQTMFDLRYLAIVFLFILLTISSTFNLLNMATQHSVGEETFIVDVSGI